MPARPIDPADKLLSSGLSPTRPFTASEAAEAGLDDRWLRRLVDLGLVTRPLRGVYLWGGVPDSLELRLECVRYVLPSGCVVTDRTAAWLHGAPMALAPNDHLVVPRVSAFHLPHHRLRNGCVDSGARTLAETDVIELAGVPVTTPLRTACDLGRLLHRDSALAALDALLRLGRFGHEELVAEAERFRGFRGVRQLRAFAPWADPGSESYGESVLRLRWIEAGLGAAPQTQVVVPRAGQYGHARLDIASERHRFAAEYDGEEFHGPQQHAHDESRRRWLREEAGWTVSVFTRHQVFGRRETATLRLRREFGAAKVRLARASAY